MQALIQFFKSWKINNLAWYIFGQIDYLFKNKQYGNLYTVSFGNSAGALHRKALLFFFLYIIVVNGSDSFKF